MSSETVDIIVKEFGSAAAEARIAGIGKAATVTEAQMNQMLLMMGNSNLKLGEIARASGSVEQSMMNIGRGTRVAADGHKAHSAAMQESNEWAGQLRETLVALGLALGAREWIELTDAYQRNINGLVQVTKSQEQLIEVQRALKDVSNDTYSSLDNNTMLYVQLTKAGKDLHISQDQMVSVIKVLNEGLLMAGKSTGDAGRAIIGLSAAMQTGEGSSRAMMSMLRQMPDLMAALSERFVGSRFASQAFMKEVESGVIPMARVVATIASMNGALVDTRTAAQRAADAHNQNSKAVLNEIEQSMEARGALVNFSQAQGELTNKVLDFSGASERATESIAHVDQSMTKWEASVKKIEPTIGMAWQRLKNELYAYVGAQDQASGASEKLAHWITLAADNSKVFFGAVQVLTAFLAAYTIRAGLAAAANLLFVSNFSGLTLIVGVFAGLAAAVLAFGEQWKITADGSITAIGALRGAVAITMQWIQALWKVVGEATGPWGQASLAVGAFVIVARVLLGINLVAWIATVTAALGRMALAAIANPYVVLAAAITAVALALAYKAGMLDTAIAALKDRLMPAIEATIAKMKEMTQSTAATGMAAKDMSNVFGNDVSPSVIRSFDSMSSTAIRDMQQMQDAAAKTAESIKGSSEKMTKANQEQGKAAEITDIEQIAIWRKRDEQTRIAQEAETKRVNAMIYAYQRLQMYGRSLVEQMSDYGMEQMFNGKELSTPVSRRFYEQKQMQTGEIDKMSAQIELLRAQGVISGTKNEQQIADLEQRLAILQAKEKIFESEGMERLRVNFQAVANNMFYNALAASMGPNGTAGNSRGGLQEELDKFMHFASGASFMVGGDNTDNNVVQFMARGDERVKVETPEQQRASDRSERGDRPKIVVNFTVQAPRGYHEDFRRNEPQIMTTLLGKLGRAQAAING